MTPTITLCICTMNRHADLRRGLEAALRCDPPPFEILVSDDGAGTASAREVVATFPGVRYQVGPGRGLGANRNACIAAARGTHLHFADDDVVIPTNFYGRAQQALVEQETMQQSSGANRAVGIVLSGAENKHVEGQAYHTVAHNADFLGYQQAPVPPNGTLRAIVINATIFPAALFQQATFDEKLRFNCDEIDMARHAYSLGYRIVQTPGLDVEHYPSPVNREKSLRVFDPARLYSTAKAYRRYEKSPGKLASFLLIAPLHLVASAVKSRKWGNVKAAFTAIWTAIGYGLSRPASEVSSQQEARS